MDGPSIIDWVAGSPLVEGVLFGSAGGGEPDLPVCAVAVIGGSRGYGKGLTRGEALCSAVGEALEQYAARQVPRASLLQAPWRELAPEAFDPRWLCLYSDRQYETPGFPYRPFDPDRPLLWTPGRWLDTGEPVWLPAAAVYLSGALEADEALCQVTSNGLAAGCNSAEAAAHASLELYERSRFVGAWLTRQPGHPCPLSDLDPEYTGMLEQAKACGAETEVYRFSADPFVAACVARGDGRGWPGVTLGLGAGWSECEAVEKAILEHGQTGPYFARVWREGEFPIPPAPENLRSFRDHALYYCDPMRACEFDFLRGGGEPLPPEDEVRTAIADLTPPDLLDSPFRLVRALARGLQPIHYGYGFERVLTPHLQAALAGRDANPAPVPIC